MATRKIEVELVGDEKDLLRALKRSENGVKKFNREVTRSGKASRAAIPQLKSLAGSYALTTGAALGLGAAVRSSFAELFEQQKVAAQTAAVIKSTGGAAGVTAKEVDKLASSLLQLSGVDDEVIARGANLLLTFTRVRNEVGAGNDVFDQATKSALDMSVAMGTDLQGAILRIGKALNDPIRGITALRRVGVQFTDAQVKLISALVKSGKTLEAQKIILRELQVEFGGSAKAAGDTLPGQMNKARESAKNLGATVAGITTPALVAFTESANDLLVALQNLNDPRKGLPSFGKFFKGLGENLPEGTEVIPTIGPFLGALQDAFGDSGKKSGKLFIAGLNTELKQGPIDTAGAERIVAFFKKQITQRFGTGTPFLEFQQAQAEQTKQLLDDLAVSMRRIAVLQERLSKATGLKEKTDLQNAVNAERDRAAAIRDQITARKRAISEARKERAEAERERKRAAQEHALSVRNAKQFALLGLGPSGGEKIPGVKGLRKSLGSISEAVKGTFLDTGKTRSLLANIRKLLAGGLGKLSEEVRAAIKRILDDIDQQLKEHSTRRRSFRIMSTASITEGLGLTREQALAVRQRLARRGRGGTVPDPGPSAFGVPVGGGRGPKGRPIQVNLVVSGKQVARAMIPELQVIAASTSGSSIGRHGGRTLGGA